MINKIYSKKVIMLFFIFLPIVEFITSITRTYTNINITFGMIYKTAFIVYTLIYLLFINKNDRTYNILVLSLIIIYSVFHIIVTIPTSSFSSITSKFVEISRFISFPIAVLFFYSFGKKQNIPLKTINYVALLYGFVMIVAGITSTAFATYDSIGLEKGQSGWFVSGNELSNLLSVFLPISLYYFTKNNKIVSYVSVFLITFGLSVIGTKTSLVGLLLGTILLIIYNFLSYLISKNIKKMIMLNKLLVFFLIVLIIIPFTPAFKFMKERYFNSVTLVCDDNDCESSEGFGLDKFIYNGREVDLKIQGMLYMKSSSFEKLFGLNDNIKPLIDSGEFNVVEQDFYDILFIYGYVGLIVFFIPLFAIIIEYLNKLRNNLKKNLTYFKTIIAISICLSFGISYIAGHVYLASTVGIITAFILSKLVIDDKNDDENKKIVIYMPKLSVGGMENALLNMLNISSVLKKYNTTLVLGYTTDKKLLELIPNYINVRLLCHTSWGKKGKFEAALNYIGELVYASTIDYSYSICYSYHHKVLSLLSRLASKNTILFMHTDLINSRTKEEIDRLNNNVKFEKFKAVVCVSNAAKKSFDNLYPNYKGKLVVINNYIDGNKIISLSKEGSDEIDINKISFINSSRHFEKAKKISRIIDSTCKLLKEGYNFNVYLVGDGEDTLTYKKMVKEYNIENNVIFLGRHSNPFKYMSRCNYVIISSDFEGYGIVIDEARVLKVPIITTNVADSKEIVTSGFGLVVSNSKEGVYEGMKKALEEKFKCIGNFDYKIFNNNIDSKFEELLDSFMEV